MKIFEPITINKTVVKNRMVVSAMVTNYCQEDGYPTEKFMAYHEHKAKGGWGMIITEDFAISKTAGAFKRLPALWEDGQIEPYKQFTDRIHKYGSTIIAQIYHAGRETSSDVTGQQCIAPSAIKDPVMSETPREMTLEDIKQVQKDFVDCAYRAYKANFDGVELHGAHGYLLGQFVSPFSNKRTDEYGGNVINRCRFVTEIIKAIREKCGEDFIIQYRMSAQEYVHGGLEIEEAKQIAVILEKAGLDSIHVSQGVYGSMPVIIPPSCVAPAHYVDNAYQIKQVVNIPVIAVGRINDPYLAETILESAKADMCTMARSSLADPDMPNKVLNGDYQDMIHCIGCVQGCSGENGKGNKVRCLVNPLTGMEDEYKIEKVNKPLNIIVVGGGISGCEAAILAATRGHKVTLLEKSNSLGGQWIAASIPVGKNDFSSFIVWQKHMLEKLKVNVVLNTEADLNTISSYCPDKVILATGSIPFVLNTEGMKEYTSVADEYLLGKKDFGKKVVVIGGGLVGAETADQIAEHGCNDVTIIEMLAEIVKDGESNPNYYLKKRLNEYGVKINTSAKVEKVTKDSVTYSKDGNSYTIENVDTIINATGRRAYAHLKEVLQNSNIEVIAVGDCNERAKNGYLAIREGFIVGLQC